MAEADREKVSRELRTLRLTLELALRNNGKLGNLGCKAGIQYVDNALALLKEQAEKIKSLEQTIEDVCCGGEAG